MPAHATKFYAGCVSRLAQSRAPHADSAAWAKRNECLVSVPGNVLTLERCAARLVDEPELPTMCRWIVYQGPELFLSRILLDPGHSLLAQSLQAREIEWPTNGDGFGIGWYDRREEPGVYRDVLPIWNDTNLLALAKQIESRLFFAHIRKSTAGAIQRTNCHPFAHGKWLFQHNGSIPDFDRLKQELYAQIDPELFGELSGSTDSECMFLLALSNGLKHDPVAGLAAMVKIVEQARQARGIVEPFHCTSAVSDGERTWAIRYSSAGTPRTLYYSTHRDALCDFESCNTKMPEGGILVASEPLGQVGGAWQQVEPNSV
ncbi:MAG: putative glutamine amidotransferase, partial [Hyphomicrobiaceae bacterium]